MNNDPLAGLKDIHLPPGVGWWPPAIGWWLILILSVTLLCFAAYKIIKYLKNKRYRKEALVELRDILLLYNETSNRERFLRDTSVLLRRVAVQTYGRYEVSELNGDEWLEFLDRTGGTDDFVNGSGSALGLEMYKPQSEIEPEKVFPVIDRWIRKHK